MIYKLGLREISDSDISAECPYMPEKEDYQMYVVAFIDDIKNLDIVESAHESNNSVIIKLVEHADFKQLHQAIIAILKKYWEQLRTTGLESIT